jgi:HSP20 family molecular chaperone IbpA
MPVAPRDPKIDEESTKGVVMTPVLEDPVHAREYPCAELHKTDEKFEIEVETPACEPEDLEVEVDGHRVTVFGESTNLHSRPFTFIFELPGDANLDRLHALFGEGLLLITAPRLPRAAKRSIPIETPHLIHGEAWGS